MNQMNAVIKNRSAVGDAAVDGLFGGIAAGVLMAVYLGAYALISGEGLAVMFGRFAVGESALPLQGFVLHLAVSSVYGVMYGIVTKSILPAGRISRFAAVAGLVYGLLLLVVARVVLLPMANSALLEIPFLHFGIAHVIYGLALGAIAGRSEG
jgi:uncharacterized membrane protein YagU involved in acid resistance